MPATNELLQEGRYPIGQPAVDPSSENFDTQTMDGDTLQELMQRNKRPFPLTDALVWADQILEALNRRHTASPAVIHKNVRPENVVLNSTGRVNLVGFESDGELDAEQCYAPLEQVWGSLDPASQNAVINSLDERSERILKEPADPRSDIYSLGATLYFLMTGRDPVCALERAIEVFDGNADPLKEPTKLAAQIPAEISDVVMKAMEIRRENRYDAAAIMRQVLKTARMRSIERIKAEAGAGDADAAAFLESISDGHTLELDLTTTSPAPLSTAETSSQAFSKAASASADDAMPSFGSSEEPAGPGIGIPVIGAAVTAVIVIAVAVWFFAFSSPKQAEQAPSQPVTQSQPAEPVAKPQIPVSSAIETTSVPSTVPSSEPVNAAEPATELVPADRKSATKPVQSQRDKKSNEAPPKTPAKQKKAVTVDDLING